LRLVVYHEYVLLIRLFSRYSTAFRTGLPSANSHSLSVTLFTRSHATARHTSRTHAEKKS